MTAEITVIGGGIVGASAAYRLAKSGAKVTIVDRGDVGYATAAGAGVVACFPGSPTQSSLPDLLLDSFLPLACAYYDELIPQLADDGETDTGYESVGALFPVIDDVDQATLAERFRGTSPGEVTLLDGKEAKRWFPPLGDFVEAFHVAGVARVAGRRLRDSLLRAVQKRGGHVVRGNACLVREAGRVNTIDVNGDRIRSDAIVVATGAWGDLLGISLGVFPSRGQILHLELPNTDASRWPIVKGHGTHYILTFPRSRVVSGATHEDDAGFDCRVTVASQGRLIADALRVAPGLADATIVETRVGFRPKSRDGLPVLGAVSDIEGLYVATGLGAGGLTMGPFVGAVVADIVQGEAAPLDIEPYSPARAALAV